MPIRAVFTADNHLGCYYARMTPSRLERRRACLRRALSCAVDHALEIGADLFLHGGDLFDAPDPRNVEIAFAAAEMRRLARGGITAVVIGGNHDTPRSRRAPGSLAPHHILKESGAILLLDVEGEEASDSGLIRCRVPLRRGELLVCSARPDSAVMERGASLPDAGERVPVLVLLHAMLKGNAPAGAGGPLLSKSAVSAFAADAVLLGHDHRPGLTRVGGLPVISAGATERLDFGEMDNRTGFWELRLEPGRLEAEYVAVTPQPMHRLRLDAAAVDAEDPTGYLLRAVEDIASPDALVRLDLFGEMDRSCYHAFRPAEIREFGLERCFHFELCLREMRLGEAGLPESEGPVSLDAELRRAALQMKEACDRDRRDLIDRALREALQRVRQQGGGA